MNHAAGLTLLAISLLIHMVQLGVAKQSLSTCTRRGDFQCLNRQCISRRYHCDGNFDCDDGSDENIGCEQKRKRSSCQSYQYQCANGQCILSVFRCDGDNDCGDLSDEQECSSYCLQDSSRFLCKNNQRCIFQHYRCDGEDDCGDSSDERNCTSYCRQDSSRFWCNKTGRCIPQRYRCNGDDDCGDLADEQDCSSYCLRKGLGFWCENSLCISKSLRCDGDNNCGDSSDENNCDITTISVLTTAVIVLMPIIILSTVIWCKKRFTFDCTCKRHKTERLLPFTENEKQTCSNELWDSEIIAEIGNLGICPTRLTVEKDIGEGNFGRVYKCLLNRSTAVAAKSAKSGVNTRDFIFEALRMKCLSHQNVLALIGICWSPNPEHEQYYRPLIVLPYMVLGDLRTYLRKEQSRYDLSSPAENDEDVTMSRDLFRLIQFGYQIAKGMEYLSGKMILHRDLAARNCMVDWDFTVKISDFGLARALEKDKDYYRITPGKVGLPIRWVALEGLTEGIFTTKSDVWSYGITLWEVMTMGTSPYPGVAVVSLLPLLQEGMRLSQPKHCPDQMFKIIADCWLENPEKRPSFQVLVNEISEFMLASKAEEYKKV
ncbi:uncharacterized protein [Oscarella lobularis]|uniref:uncharacterized protein n=1 Tax=Oscarella lobularis TaxID=121494 RepID=UPI0033138A2F